MAGKSAILTVKILTDASQAGKGIDTATSKFGKFQAGVSKLTPYAVAAGAGIAAFGKQAVDSASRTQQAMGALDSVFGKQVSTVKAWAADSASSVGLAESEYAELASTIGAQLQNMGLSSQEAAGATNDLIGLGSDLAATFGGTTAEAVGALSAALRGEADPAERYGLALNQTAVQAALAEKGMDGLTGKAATTAKAETLLALASEQAGGAVGQFARETDTAAGSAQIASANWENAKSALGESLLPAVTAATTALAAMASWMTDNATTVTVLVAAVGALAAGVLAANVAIKVYQATLVAWSAVTKAATIAQRALNVAMRMNPIGLVITAVVALVAGIVLLWKKNEGFRNFVTAAWKAIANAAKAAWNGIKAIANLVIKGITAYIKAYLAVGKAVWRGIQAAAKAAWNGIRSVVSSVTSWITSKLRSVSAAAKAIWSAIKSSATSSFNAIKSVVSGIANAIRSILNGVKSAATAVWNAIKSSATAAFRAVLSPIRTVQAAIDRITSAVQSAIGWIKRIKFPSPPSWLSKIIPGGVSATYTPAVAGPSPVPLVAGLGAGRATTVTGGGNIIINVSGTLNDADSARAVRRVLRNDSRRRGGVIIERRRGEVMS